LSLVLVDSTAFLSLEDADEVHHRRTRELVREAVATGRRLITSNFVFDETYTLILARLGRARAFAWGQSLRAGKLVGLLRIDADHEDRAWKIIQTFADKEFSYTDATSFALAESLDIRSALSWDRHFQQYGKLEVLA